MLITTRLNFLQQIQSAAIGGYKFYTTGRVIPEKLPGLVRKFEKQYHVNQTRQQAYRARKSGKASAKFFIYADETDLAGYKLFWVLLLTEGSHSAKQDERLKNLTLRKQRFVYSDYELIQKPRQDGKQKFTFQMTTEAMEFYSQRVRQVVRSKNQFEVEKLITHLNAMPGFSGVRRNKDKIKRIYLGESKRAFDKEEVKTLSRMTSFYHRRVKNQHVVNIRVFVSEMLKHNRTVKQQLKAYRSNQSKRGKPKSIVMSITEPPKSIWGKIFEKNKT